MSQSAYHMEALRKQRVVDRAFQVRTGRLLQSIEQGGERFVVTKRPSTAHSRHLRSDSRAFSGSNVSRRRCHSAVERTSVSPWNAMGGDTAYGNGGRHSGGSRTRSSSNSSTETDWYPTMHGDASETLFQRPGRRFSNLDYFMQW